MKQKTAMMELRDSIKASIGSMNGELNDYKSGYKQCLIDIQYQIDNKLLEKEKEQIEESNLVGFECAIDVKNGLKIKFESNKDYYNQTYLEESK